MQTTLTATVVLFVFAGTFCRCIRAQDLVVVGGVTAVCVNGGPAELSWRSGQATSFDRPKLGICGGPIVDNCATSKLVQKPDRRENLPDGGFEDIKGDRGFEKV